MAIQIPDAAGFIPRQSVISEIGPFLDLITGRTAKRSEAETKYIESQTGTQKATTADLFNKIAWRPFEYNLNSRQVDQGDYRLKQGDRQQALDERRTDEAANQFDQEQELKREGLGIERDRVNNEKDFNDKRMSLSEREANQKAYTDEQNYALAYGKLLLEGKSDANDAEIRQKMLELEKEKLNKQGSLNEQELNSNLNFNIWKTLIEKIDPTKPETSSNANEMLMEMLKKSNPAAFERLANLERQKRLARVQEIERTQNMKMESERAKDKQSWFWSPEKSDSKEAEMMYQKALQQYNALNMWIMNGEVHTTPPNKNDFFMGMKVEPAPKAVPRPLGPLPDKELPSNDLFSPGTFIRK